MTSLRTHETTFEAARKNLQITQEAFKKARDKYADALKLHGYHATSATVRAMAPQRGLPTTGSGDAPPSGSRPARSERESSSSEATSHIGEEDDPNQTIPMEVYSPQTGETTRCSWSDRVDNKETWGQQSSRSHKRRQGTSEYESDVRTVSPFIFSDEVRAIAVGKLFNNARASLSAQSAWIRPSLRHNIPALQCSDQGIVHLTNLLLVCVNEYHLTRSIRGCGPLLPPEIEGQLRDLKKYLPHDEVGFPSTDVQEKDKGNILRLACWLHCLDMVFTYSRGTAQSLRREDHEEIGSLLQFLLAPRVGPLTSADVIERVLLENQDDTLRQLEEAQNSLKSGQARLPQLEKEIAEAKQEVKHIKKKHTTWPSDVQHTQRKCECLQQEKK